MILWYNYKINKKGFTLIELLITVAVIGILAMVAIPAFVGSQKRAAKSEAYANLQNLRLLEERFYAENGCYYMPSGGACTNTTITGVASIQAFLPGFNPGSSLNYTYSVTTTSSGQGGGTASYFSAAAAGISGTKVSGDTFTIDCNNNKNF